MISRMPHNLFARRACSSGFTLIEFIITILLASILAGIFVNFFSLGTDIFYRMYSSQDVKQIKRLIINRMGYEIRQADELTINSATDLSFSSDIDSDGVAEQVRYFMSGNELHKTIDGAGDTVLIQNASVTFTGDSDRVVISLAVSFDGAVSRMRTAMLRRRSL